MLRKHITKFLMIGFLLTVTANPAFAQRRGGFDPTRFFDFVDKNKDGKLDAEEVKNLPGPMREGLEKAGIDLKKSLTKEQLSEAMQKMREAREEEGGDRGRGGRSGGFFGGGPPRGDDRGRDDRGGGDRGRDDRDRGDRGGDDRRGNDRNSSDRQTTTQKSFTPKPGVRISQALPDQFAEGDTNVDGQIGFYEWKRWKSGGFSEFNRLDLNGDGFVTPRELAMAPPVEETPEETADATSDDDKDGDSAESRSESSDKPIETVNMEEADPAKLKDAKYQFSLLDRDKDGQVTLQEWAASRRIRPKFEEAGVDLNEPMQEKRFIEVYLTVNK